MTLSQVNLFCRWLLNLLVTTEKLLRLHENVNCLPVKEDVTCYLIQLYLLKSFSENLQAPVKFPNFSEQLKNTYG